ncbi:MAG: Exodeoxyribonuclease 7 large subunit [Parcubacteria group bacterium Gr01-1014_46]|nr:MAG: Exodeoxyribonuclease 7 large subunit [Parcubacteria group bacterium Gr01-1014_46]
MSQNSQTDIISVSEYLDKLNLNLKEEKARIIGEVSGVQEYPGRSYLYFSIKDSKDASTMKCFMWKRDFTVSGVELRDGLEIIVSAYPSIYKPNGGLTLQVETIELVGEGALQIAYEKLKKKLELEGLFSIERKKALPEYPHKIGVITSKSGAVINDFLTNIGKFGFEIIFVDSKVEGIDAVKDLLSALETLKNKDLDVLVMMRGGGSLESFQAFNNEVLVRAVADFGVPVITGIGHDKDAPLVSMVSDKNVSTPTAVANLLNQSWNEALYKVNSYEEKIFSNFNALIEVFRKAEDTLLRSVDRIESSIDRYKENITGFTKDLVSGFENLVGDLGELLQNSGKVIELSNPERQLAHGYSIVRSGNKIVKSKKDVRSGDDLDIMVSDGRITSKVI